MYNDMRQSTGGVPPVDLPDRIVGLDGKSRHAKLPMPATVPG